MSESRIPATFSTTKSKPVVKPVSEAKPDSTKSRKQISAEKGWETRRENHPPTVAEWIKSILTEEANDADRYAGQFFKITPEDVCRIMMGFWKYYAEYFKKNGTHDGCFGMTTQELERRTNLSVLVFEAMDKNPISLIRYTYDPKQEVTYWNLSTKGKQGLKYYGYYGFERALLASGNALKVSLNSAIERLNERASERRAIVNPAIDGMVENVDRHSLKPLVEKGTESNTSESRVT